jgi:O-antigen/teichoic acid export membrane protein
MASQFVGILALVGVPLLLANVLKPEDYGVYAQFQLLLQTFLIFAIAGFPEALVYFVARKRAEAADFLLGALIQLATALLIIAAVLVLAWPVIVGRLASDALSLFRTPLLLAVVFYAVGDTLFTAQTAQKRFRTFSIVYVAFAVFQSAVVLATALKTRALGPVVWAYVFTGATKAAGALVYIGIEWARTGWSARPRMLREQWAYALPYTGTQALKKFNGVLHRFFVTSSFSDEAYAAYDIGTKKVPALGIVRGSFVQVMTPHFAEMEEQKRHRAILGLWHASASRLSLIYYPIVGILIAFAPEAFAVLLPDAYSPGIVIFQIFALVMVGDALGGIEALLKAFAQNRFILWTTAVQLAIALVGSWVGLKQFGLPGPAVAVVVASYVGQWIRIARIHGLMGVRFADLLPWGHLAKTALVACAATLVGWGVGNVIPSPWITLIVGIPFTAGAYLSGLVALGLIPRSEKERLAAVWRRFAGGGSGR